MRELESGLLEPAPDYHDIAPKTLLCRDLRASQLTVLHRRLNT